MKVVHSSYVPIDVRALFCSLCDWISFWCAGRWKRPAQSNGHCNSMAMAAATKLRYVLSFFNQLFFNMKAFSTRTSLLCIICSSSLLEKHKTESTSIAISQVTKRSVKGVGGRLRGNCLLVRDAKFNYNPDLVLLGRAMAIQINSFEFPSCLLYNNCSESLACSFSPQPGGSAWYYLLWSRRIIVILKPILVYLYLISIMTIHSS